MRPIRRSGSTTIARNIWPSSTPATRSRRSPIAPPTSCARSGPPRLRCAYSMPAWATRRCWRAHAQRACVVAKRAAPGGRQGDQPRGCAARAREDAGSLSRASDDRAGRDQPAIRRCAGAAAARGRRPHAAQLAGAATQGQFISRLRAPDRRIVRRARLRLGDAAERSFRQSRVCAAVGAGHLPGRSRVHARRRRAAAGITAGRLRLHPRLAAVARAHVGGIQGGQGAAAAHAPAGAARAPAGDPVAWRRSRSRDRTGVVAG